MTNKEKTTRAIELLTALASSNEKLKEHKEINVELMYLWEKANKLIDLLKEKTD